MVVFVLCAAGGRAFPYLLLTAEIIVVGIKWRTHKLWRFVDGGALEREICGSTKKYCGYHKNALWTCGCGCL